MFNRNFLIAVLFSFAVHMAWITVIGVKTPSSLCRDRIYTQIEFLGPILGKTTFDIMIERSDPYNVSYRSTEQAFAETMLNVDNEKEDLGEGIEVPSYDRYSGGRVYKSLSSVKSVPDVLLEKNYIEKAGSGVGSAEDGYRRDVVFRPEEPYIRKGDHGQGEIFAARFNVLVSSSGKVKLADMFVSTGYSEVDAAAIEYVEGWLFEPAAFGPYAQDEWLVVDVAIRASED
jgi:hypothetical protein